MLTTLITALVVVMAVGGESGREGGSTTLMDEPPHNLTIFQRVSVEGVVQLLNVAKRAEPHSCWCRDPYTTPPPHIGRTTLPLLTVPASPCPVLIPTTHLSKVLKKRCQVGRQHCCLKRGSDLRRSDLGPAWEDMRVEEKNNAAILGHLEHLIDMLATNLTPEGQGVAVPGQVPSTDPVINLDLPTLPAPPTKHQSKTKNPSQDSHLLAMFQAAAQYLLGQKKGGVFSSPFQNKTHNASGGVGVGGVDFLSTVKELLANETVSKLMGKVSQRLKRSTADLTINDIDATDLKNTETNTIPDITNTLFEKGDIVLSYSQLGWFSRAVEAAMDGSLFVGMIVVTLLTAGSLLTTVLPMVTDTCLVCALIGYANTVAKAEEGF